MDYEKEALEYHSRAPAGKTFTGTSKPCATQADLSLAYTPGVAGPCRAIHKNEDDSFKYTGRANLVGVISNGTAVLGLGDIGPHAAKPVMEGKAVLFKRFADIDVFDIELNAKDPDAFIAAVQAMEPTFGGINLEDIKAPECFYIEEKLKATMSIPVMHDDQHGTAIIAGAAFLNAMELSGRKMETTRVVFSGGGAAAIACASLFLGIRRENLIMCDSKGVIFEGRKDGMNEFKLRFANKTATRTLEQALDGADAFVGVSAANVLPPVMIMKMAANPIIFALANPDPEILPSVARAARPDAIIATGRSDFPNQVNNVLGFPFIFRGALDVRATCINDEMKMAAVRAIAGLAKEDVPDVVMRAYKSAEGYQFGRDYLIPKPVDPRVLMRVAPAVAKAAMDSGVARKKIDIEAYIEQIEKIQGPSRRIMRRLRKGLAEARAKSGKTARIVLANGADRRVLRAAAQVADEGEIKLCLLGDRAEILAAAEKNGVKGIESRVEIVDPQMDPRLEEFGQNLFELRARRGVSLTTARQLIVNPNYFAAMMVKGGHADGMINGLAEPYSEAARPILEVIGPAPGRTLAGIYMIMVQQKLLFFADCTININPDAEKLARIAVATAELAERYTTDPLRIAMLSFSSFGANRHPDAERVAKAVELVRQRAPHLLVDGEMQADVALNLELQKSEFGFCGLGGEANILIFPNLDAANIAYKLLTNLSDAVPVGPILTGLQQPGNVLQRSATTEEVISMMRMTAFRSVRENVTEVPKLRTVVGR